MKPFANYSCDPDRATRLFEAVLLACALALAPAVTGAEWSDDVQVHGFATQGFLHTSDNDFFGDSESGSFEFTELGINLSYRATPSLLFSGQLLSRRAGEIYDGSPTIDFALMDWTVVTEQTHAFGLMFGRTKNPIGLYNDTRDVAFTRPSIFLPQQIYFDNVRNLILSADGLQAYAKLYTDTGTWSFNAGIGHNTIDENVEISYLDRDFGGEFEPANLAMVGRAEFETTDGAWRGALSAAKARLAFDADATDPIGNGEIDFLFWVASLQYNAEYWSLTAEYMEQPVEFDGFSPLYDARDSTVQGYYLQGSYLLRNDVELVARYAEGFASKDDRNGRRFAAGSFGMAPPHSFYQKDLMLGLRWDVTPSLMLRVEHQWSEGTWTLSRRENPSPLDHAKDWQMFSLLASYRF